MTNPYFTYISTYAGKLAASQSGVVTFSFSNTAGFEAFIPIKILSSSNFSAGAEVYVMRSTDGGATYETFLDAPLGMVFQKGTNAASNTQIKDLILRDPGQYLITVQTGGGAASTWSVDFGATIAMVSAYA